MISQLMYEIITWMISVDFSSSNAFAFDVIDAFDAFTFGNFHM